MGELRLKFEETEFFKRTLIDATQPYISFKDGEYKGPQNLMSFIIRLNSGWDVFKEQQSKIEGLEKEKQQALQRLKGFSRLVAEDLICDQALANLIKSKLKYIEKALRGDS